MKNITDKKLESILKNISSEARPDKSFMYSLEEKLQKQFEETYPKQQSFFSRFLKLKLQFASALVIVFFTSTTIYAYTSDTVVSGDLLYPLKQGTEKIEELLAVTPERKIEYYNKMADRRMKEFTHIEQKRNRIDKPTLKEAKRLIELSEQEFVGEFETQQKNRIQFEPENEIQQEQSKNTNEKKREHIIEVKEKMKNTREHFEEKFEPRLEELEKLEREMMKEITQDLPFNNFSPDIQNMIDTQNPPPQQQPHKNFQPEPQNSDFPNNSQDPQQQQSPQHTQPPQPATVDFPIQPGYEREEEFFSDYLKISTPEDEPQEYQPQPLNPPPEPPQEPIQNDKFQPNPNPKPKPFIKQLN